MSLFRQILIANSRKKKRPYYVGCEYLESTGTQYIDTGIRLTQNNAIEVCYKINGISDFSGVVGARTSANSNNISVTASTGGVSSPFISVDFNNSNFETYRARYDERTSDKIVAYLDKHIRRISINDSVVVSNNTECTDTVTTQSNCLLFRATGINGYCDLNMYYCKIWDGDTLVRDFIPVLDWDMKPCMYDKVSGELFYNKATSGGDFIPGRQIHPVEYLESTGTQYIDTGVVPTSSMNAKIDFYIPSTTPKTEQHILGAMGGSGAQNGGRYQFLGFLHNAGDVWRTAYGEFTSKDNNWGKVIYDEKVHFDITLQNGISTVYINNSTTPDWTLTYEEDVITPSSIHMFALNNSGTTSALSTCRVYSCSISHNGTLLRDYIPMVDENGVGAMFDRVTHTIYDNAGQGAFSYPPVELEYLESTGTQYIDTGIMGTNENMGIDVTWAFSNNNANMCIFSSRSAQTSNTLTLFWIKTASNASNQVRFDGVDQRHFTDGVNASVSDDIFNFNYKSTTGAVATLTNKTTEHIQTLFVGKLKTFSTNPLYLFCSRDSAYVYSWIKMYGCKIYDGDVVVRDYIPVFYNGKAGMWDKVNEVFYPNLGTGEFSVSRIVEPEYE